MAMGRRLPQIQALLAQQALRTAIPKPRPLPTIPSRLLHCSTPPAAASRPPLPRFPWRSSGRLLPVSAAAVAAAARAAAKRWLTARAAGPLELFSLQRRGSSRWFSSSSSSTSPRRSFWARFIPSPDGMVLMLMVANVAVYMLWQKADPTFMRDHFTISLENVSSGRLYTLLTNAFSHAEPPQLFSNMMCLYFFGSSISSCFGPSFLLKLYVAGALVGSAFYLVERLFTAPRKQDHVEGDDSSRTSGLGARAAVNAIFLLYAFLNPKGKVYLYFLIRVPAAAMGAVWIALDLLRVREGERRASGFFHLGGTVVAALAWARIRKGWI